MENTACTSNDEDIIREEHLPNGDVYVGKFHGPVPHGFGKYTWSDGAIYEGEWDLSRITGKGQIVWQSGAVYEGEVVGGFLEGSGTLKGVDGSIYDGSWHMRKYYGMGMKTYPNSDVYEGNWKEGLQEGVGKYTWSNGTTYVGNWKRGKMSSKGVMQWKNGDLYNGYWHNGLMHGIGYYRYNDGIVYVGTWSKGLKDGQGILYPAESKIPCDPLFSELFGYTNSCPSVNFKGLCPEKIVFLILTLVRLCRRSPRISNGNVSVIEGGYALPQEGCNTASSSSGSKTDAENERDMVYEREYMQGILIMERPRYWDELKAMSVKNRKKNLWRKQVKGPGETIYKGHKSYFLMLNLQLGIRYTVGKITPVPLREVRSSDFGPRARIRMYFPHEGTQYTPPHHSINFFWKDYCPMVFRNLREMFKIDAADYMMSICGGDSLKELSSPGKSGSIFYLSQDERFVIKTLKKTEVKVLLKMLPKYYVHVGAYENTLITKFFGLHRITLKSGRKVRFVVMGNMFRTELRIHRRYDLKGSTQGRFTKKENIKETTTLKDLDLTYVFYVEKSWREALFRQISLDCMFLESQSIIDYSMLLGIHFRAPEHLRSHLDQDTQPLESENPAACNSSDSVNPDEIFRQKGFLLVAHEPGSVSSAPGSHIRGSMVRASEAGDEEVDLVLPGTGRLRVQLGVNMPARACLKDQDITAVSNEDDTYKVYDVVLYLGIIDILQEYNVKKKIEHCVKSLKYDPLSISAVEPSLYAKRFMSFLEKVFPEQ
ncbi:Phosphatidylinositol-4-phosphate 5-kinase family protein [Rhynchospora pubera]|uniref:Phosphatidylinositol 4-phosphate 5-kinase n=1 Tax=Rhynchospora pubera TaxID=906938 RepID=A0AAV8FED5_9POAL|nr:Phosphatidylinositol-4-phosphate 5-kinase family protein [Rhynchospora pubera]